MSTNRDEIIQEKLDRGEDVETGEDVAAYRRVYSGLAYQPVELPVNFVESVIARIVQMRLATKESLTMLLAVTGTVLAVAFGIGSVFLLRGLGYLEEMTLDLPASVPHGALYFVVVLMLIASLDAVLGQLREKAR